LCNSNSKNNEMNNVSEQITNSRFLSLFIKLIKMRKMTEQIFKSDRKCPKSIGKGLKGESEKDSRAFGRGAIIDVP
jgi:hypothetical protein